MEFTKYIQESSTLEDKLDYDRMLCMFRIARSPKQVMYATSSVCMALGLWRIRRDKRGRGQIGEHFCCRFDIPLECASFGVVMGERCRRAQTSTFSLGTLLPDATAPVH